MTTDEVSTIIDQLCDKLGLAVDSMAELVPELARANIAIYGFDAAIGFLLIILSVVAIVFYYRRGKRLMDWHKIVAWIEYTPILIVGITGAVVIVFGFFLLLVGLESVIWWVSAPEVAAIEYILDLL